ncbi:uncharacterized protein LOC141608031 [Silene latifolia]|uniref:uncharacterized protein LOC141608031 n=1 Tax=Silene latifolia TaxID=37657 RepID=UPI003D7817A0
MLSGEAVDLAEQSDRLRERWLWNNLWKVPVWPRVKLFFWQLCSEALATKENIVSRIGGESSPCPLCNLSIESSIHLFRYCGVAKWVWEGLGWDCEVPGGGSSVQAWVEEVWREIGAGEYGKFMLGCWAIWEHRNKVIFDEVDVNPELNVRRVGVVMHDCEGVEEYGGAAWNRKDRKEGDGRVTGGRRDGKLHRRDT